MLVFDDPGVRNFIICIVHDRISLIISHINHFCLKSQRTILQLTVTIVIKFIDHTGKEDLICLGSQFLSICKEVCIQAHLHAFQHLLDNAGISALRDSLIWIFKVIVIISITQRKSFYDERRKIFALSAPLLSCISLHKLLIYILSNQRKRLFFKVLRMCDMHS